MTINDMLSLLPTDWTYQYLIMLSLTIGPLLIWAIPRVLKNERALAAETKRSRQAQRNRMLRSAAIRRSLGLMGGGVNLDQPHPIADAFAADVRRMRRHHDARMLEVKERAAKLKPKGPKITVNRGRVTLGDMPA